MNIFHKQIPTSCLQSSQPLSLLLLHVAGNKGFQGFQGTPVQPAIPVGGTVQIKQLIFVPDRVLCTRYFVL